MDKEKSRYSLTYGGLPHGPMGSGGIEDQLDTTKGLPSVLEHSTQIIANYVDKTHKSGFILPKEYTVGTIWESPPDGPPREAGRCIHDSSSKLEEQLDKLLDGAVGSQGSVTCKSVLGDKTEVTQPLPLAPSSKLSLDR